MNSPNTTSLFHFTANLDYLKDIISNGFRYSYSYEVYPKSVIHNEISDKKTFFYPNTSQNNAVAIPMICFCDIPLSRTLSHRKIYNNYAIGIDKEFALTFYGDCINPIHYRISTNNQVSLSDISVIKGINNNKCHDLRQSINYFIAMSKPYKGCILDDGERCFYDEREWRIFLPDDKESDHQWHWNIHFNSREEFKQWRKPFNESLVKSEYGRLVFVKKKTLMSIEEDILKRLFTHIIVSNDDEIENVVDYISNNNNAIFGYKQLKRSTRLLIASKVTSITRIENDY